MIKNITDYFEVNLSLSEISVDHAIYKLNNMISDLELLWTHRIYILQVPSQLLREGARLHSAYNAQWRAAIDNGAIQYPMYIELSTEYKPTQWSLHTIAERNNSYFGITRESCEVKVMNTGE